MSRNDRTVNATGYFIHYSLKNNTDIQFIDSTHERRNFEKKEEVVEK